MCHLYALGFFDRGSASDLQPEDENRVEGGAAVTASLLLAHGGHRSQLSGDK